MGVQVNQIILHNDMKLENKKILVTGADGFIGSHLTEELVRQGHSVKAFVSVHLPFAFLKSKKYISSGTIHNYMQFQNLYPMSNVFESMNIQKQSL